MIADTGGVVGNSSDQQLISYLNEIAEGDQTAFARLMEDSSLDLKSDYVSELIENIKKNYWTSSNPLLPIVTAAIECKEGTESARYEKFFGKLLDELISQPAVLPESLFRPDEFAAFQASHTQKVYEVIASALNNLYQDNRYSQLMDVIFRTIKLCPLNDKETIVEPLIRVYYTKEMAQHWAQISQTTGNELNAICHYFEVALAATSYEPRSSELIILISEALLSILYTCTHGAATSIEKFFDGYGADKKLQKGLLARANNAEVRVKLSSDALKALEGLQATYGKEREGDYIYLRQQELDYITNRCLVGNGLLRGEFKIDKYILFNGQPVNTIWELKGHRFYITIDDLDNKQKLYYIIPKTELTSKNKKRY